MRLQVNNFTQKLDFNVCGLGEERTRFRKKNKGKKGKKRKERGKREKKKKKKPHRGRKFSYVETRQREWSCGTQ